MTLPNDDTWDPATKVGATATMAAASRAIATRHQRAAVISTCI